MAIQDNSNKTEMVKRMKEDTQQNLNGEVISFILLSVTIY